MIRNRTSNPNRRNGARLGCTAATARGPGYRLDPRRCDQACRDLGLRPPSPLSGTAPAAPAASPPAASPPPAALATCFAADDLPTAEQVIEVTNGLVVHDTPCDVLANHLRHEGRCACVLDDSAPGLVPSDAPHPADAAAPAPASATEKCGVAVATGPGLDPGAASEPAALGDLRLIRTVVGDVAIPEPIMPASTAVEPVPVLGDAAACATPTPATPIEPAQTLADAQACATPTAAPSGAADGGTAV